MSYSPPADPSSLADAAREIWLAGVAAVRSEQLIARAVSRTGSVLHIGGEQYDLRDWERIAVVGGGKGGAGMAAALEEILSPEIAEQRVTGWINVPADCVRPLRCITLHPGRPAGVNEPTADGVVGTNEILRLVSALGPRDLCFVLLSGGGSALLPAPLPGISLEDKQGVTRFLMRAGATIEELNTVRKRLSRVKGGGLARACPAGAIISLIISDVIGDPLGIIASGPTIAETGSAAEALRVLECYHAQPPEISPRILQVLREQEQSAAPAPAAKLSADAGNRVRNHVIGNNRVALEAAAARAALLGYRVESLGDQNRGTADAEGLRLAHRALKIRAGLAAGAPPVCLLSGGEPVVHLPPTDRPRTGGRNQQLALAALVAFWEDGANGIALLSGGTDGEDGPTDAAGACVSAENLAHARRARLDPHEYLARCDAYTFFDQCGGLLKTGPTHTNVMDLRVVLVQS